MKTPASTKAVSRAKFLRNLSFAASLLPAAAAIAQTEQLVAPPMEKPDLGNLRTFVELARSDIRTTKALVIAENLPFTEDEAVEFWPIHKEYAAEFDRLLDERYAGLLEFARNSDAMTNTQATSLADRAFRLEEKRTALKRKYFKRFKKVIPPVKAARFFQLENQINMAVDLQIAASLPLIK